MIHICGLAENSKGKRQCITTGISMVENCLSESFIKFTWNSTSGDSGNTKLASFAQAVASVSLPRLMYIWAKMMTDLLHEHC